MLPDYTASTFVKTILEYVSGSSGGLVAAFVIAMFSIYSLTSIVKWLIGNRDCRRK